ncbi:MAG: segregation and condensation protein A [Planctomycetota bacterium]
MSLLRSGMVDPRRDPVASTILPEPAGEARGFLVRRAGGRCYPPAVSAEPPSLGDAPGLGRDHRVELEPYSGPLDLLLWLIRQEEVDIHDIPIALILERYLEVVKTLQFLDLDRAGEFLVMASTLMQIKSRSLLPRDEPLDDEELDPRFELVKKLLEYRRFKEVSGSLSERAGEWARRFPPGRAPDVPGVPPDEIPLAEVSLFDLALAFSRVMSEVGVDRDVAIVYDDVPIETHVREILSTLEARQRIPFSELFPRIDDRVRIAGIFLALLELIRRRRVSALQKAPFEPIELLLRPEEEALEES